MANIPSDDAPHPTSHSGESPAELLKKLEEQGLPNAKESTSEYGDVEALSVEVKEEAIAIAREILEKLKIVYEGIDLEELVTLAGEETLDDFCEDVDDLRTLFEYQIDQAMKIDPAIAHDPEVAMASDAVGLMTAMTKAYAKKKNKEINEEMLSVIVQKEMLQAQQRSPHIKGKTVDKLAEDVERGLSKVQNRTRDTQRQMTPESLDLRLEQGMETRGLAPERSQQQQQQQQQAQQQQAASQALQAQRAMQQAVRQAGQNQQVPQAINGAQVQMKRATSGQVQDVVRRRTQQQLRNANQQPQQQSQRAGVDQQRIQTQQQQRLTQQQQQQQRQAWLQQVQQRQRQLMRQLQLARELARIKVMQKALAERHTSHQVHHDDHHHDSHHDDHHHDHQGPKSPKILQPLSSKGLSLKGDLSKLLAGTDLAALKNNLSSVDASKTTVGPRTAKDTVKEIQAKESGIHDPDQPPLPPKKGPVMGV